MRIKDISVKWQVMALCFILVSAPLITSGIISYNTAKKKIMMQILESNSKTLSGLDISKF